MSRTAWLQAERIIQKPATFVFFVILQLLVIACYLDDVAITKRLARSLDIYLVEIIDFTALFAGFIIACILTMGRLLVQAILCLPLGLWCFVFCLTQMSRAK